MNLKELLGKCGRRVSHGSPSALFQNFTKNNYTGVERVTDPQGLWEQERRWQQTKDGTHFWKVGSRGRSGESHGSMGEAEGLIPTQVLWGTAGGRAGGGHESTVPGAVGSHTLPTPAGHLRCSLGRMGIKHRKYGEQTEI